LCKAPAAVAIGQELNKTTMLPFYGSKLTFLWPMWPIS